MSEYEFVNRRRVLLLAGVSVTTGLAGCFGDDDEDGDGANGGDAPDDGTDADDSETTQLSTDDATAVIEGFVEAARGGDRARYEEYSHGDGPLYEGDDLATPLFPAAEVDTLDVDEQNEDALTAVASVVIEATDAEEDVEFELRVEDDVWQVWDWELVGSDVPAKSPELVVEEFFETLAEGDSEAASAMVDDEFEGGHRLVEEAVQLPDISLESVDTVQRENGLTEVEVQFTFTDPDGTHHEETERWVLRAEDGEWLFAGFE